MATTRIPETEAARDSPGVPASVKSLRRERSVRAFALESTMRPKTRVAFFYPASSAFTISLTTLPSARAPVA